MSKVKVLIKGYAKHVGNTTVASSTTVLIDDSGKKIIVDPGINRQLLYSSLNKVGLTYSDIDIVFMTHYHPDHVFLAPLFTEALIVDGDTRYEDDKETGFTRFVPGTKIEVIVTPGHAHEHCSLLAHEGTKKTVIAGDVFWWMNNETQETKDIKKLLSHVDSYAKDEKALVKSRGKLLKIADLIIPGHGESFTNPLK